MTYCAQMSPPIWRTLADSITDNTHADVTKRNFPYQPRCDWWEHVIGSPAQHLVRRIGEMESPAPPTRCALSNPPGLSGNPCVSWSGRLCSFAWYGSLDHRALMIPW